MNLPATANSLTVVIIDDDDNHIELMQASVEAAIQDRHTRTVIRTYNAPDHALVDLPVEGRVVILCDYFLTDCTGLQWLDDFRKANVGPVIIVTCMQDELIAAEAFRQGAADYIDKATMFENPTRLGTLINEALRRFKLEHTNRDLARELKIANNELQRNNERLSEITRIAHRFVEDVAHEFRTPLAVIKEFASILSDGIGGSVTSKQAEYLKFITDASRDLAHLIDDFLDSGKLRARTLRVDRREHSVRELIEGSWAMLQSRGTAKDITLERQIDDNLPTVFADEDKVRRTLINLVVNAIKFSSPGGVVTISACATEFGSIAISVADRGSGLSDEELDHLFERFSQGDGSERMGSKGFGLGLNIVKELVSINLGEVSVTSALGEGSTFSFTLPQFDIECIVDGFIHRVAERAPNPMLSCLRLRHTRMSLEKLRSFAASMCDATDVLLPGADGQSLLAIGETFEPERWRARLLGETRNSDRNVPPTDENQINIEVVGTWCAKVARDALLRVVRPSTVEMKRCA